VLHAVDVREEIAMRAFELSEAEVRRQRLRSAQRARTALEEMIAESGRTLRDAVPAIGFGDAASVVLARERVVRAELLVIGKRTRGALADFFLGSVTQRVLAGTRADVLVLPRGDAIAARLAGMAPRLGTDLAG
jgi:nucleotide-binding universal stress UspA family protein